MDLRSRTLERLGGTAARVLPPSAHERLREVASPARRRFRSMSRHDDTFLVGHPKSGNTWLALMVATLLEPRTGIEVTLADVGAAVPAIHASDLNIGRHEDLPSPRVFRQERPWFPELYPRTLYVVRDPRAVYTSYYHHALHDTGRTDWSLDEAVDELLEHGCFRDLEPWLERWDRHVERFLALAERQPVLVVRYEDLHADVRFEMARVAGFLGLGSDVEAVERAVRRGGFDAMRAEEETHGAEPYSGTRGEGGFYTRKGTVDSWRDELSDGAAARIEAELGPTMRRLGYR